MVLIHHPHLKHSSYFGLHQSAFRSIYNSSPPILYTPGRVTDSTFIMVNSKIISAAMMAMLSASSLAAVLPNAIETAPVHQLDTRDWVTFDFKGKTIGYNPAAFNISSADTESSATVKRDDNDLCGDSSYSGTEGPWPNESDCATLGDWASREKKSWDVQGNTPDYHGIIYAGTCVFGAGTKNFFGAQIGTSDISAAISESISRFAVCYMASRNLL
jgi:hypothetical protein